MNVIIILITASMFVAIGFLIAFFWAMKDGQYEDDYTPSVRILFETESPETITKAEKDVQQFKTNPKP